MRNVGVEWIVVVSHLEHNRNLKVTMFDFSKNAFVRYASQTIIRCLPAQANQRFERFSADSKSHDRTSVISLRLKLAQNLPRFFEDARCFSDDVVALRAIGRAI